MSKRLPLYAGSIASRVAAGKAERSGEILGGNTSSNNANNSGPSGPPPVGEVWVPIGARGRGIPGTASDSTGTNNSFTGQNIYWSPSNIAITELKLVWADFQMAVSGAVAKPSGAVFLDFAAGINYQGVTQGAFTWSNGNANTTISAPSDPASFGAVVTDAKAVTIPANRSFGVRYYGRMAVATNFSLAEYQQAANGALGTRLNPAAASPGGSAVTSFTEGMARGTDLANVVTGVGAQSHSGLGYLPPSVILAKVNNPSKSLMIFGDSITAGAAGDYPDSLGNIGFVGRSLRNNVPWVNLARGTLQASFFNTSAKRAGIDALMFAGNSYVTDYLCLMGRNDIVGGRTALQTRDDVDFLCAPHKAAGRRCWVGTVIPFTTSTDSFVTVANQTLANSARNDERIAYNADRRANFAAQGYRGVVDIDAVLRDGTDTNKWKCPIPAFTLVTPITTTGQTGNITVSSTAGISAQSMAAAQILIGTERMQCTVVNGTTLNILARAQDGTTATTHLAAATINVPLTNDGSHPNYNGHELLRLANVFSGVLA